MKKGLVKELYSLTGGKDQESIDELRRLIGLSPVGESSAEFVEHSLATAASDFLVASGAAVFVKKSLVETKSIIFAAAVPAHSVAGLLTVTGASGGKTIKAHGHNIVSGDPGTASEYTAVNEFKGEYDGEEGVCDGISSSWFLNADSTGVVRALYGEVGVNTGKTLSGNTGYNAITGVMGAASANAGVLNGAGVTVTGVAGVLGNMGATLTECQYLSCIWGYSSSTVDISGKESQLLLLTTEGGGAIKYGINIIPSVGNIVTGIKIGSTTTAAIDITAAAGRAIRVGTKGTTYANSTSLAISSLGGTLDTDPAKNYMVGVFTKVQGDESASAVDDLGSAWFRTRTDTGVTTPSGYSLYGVKSQLRIYSAADAGATTIANWAAAGMLGVLEVSGAATSFSSGCIAAAVYGNVALGTGSTIDSGAVVAALAAISASSVITANADASYYGLYVGKSGAVVFDAGVRIADSSCTTGISIGGTTNAINITDASAITNLFTFNEAAGCILETDVEPVETPSEGGLGADGCIVMKLGANTIYVPYFTDLHS